jgi:hypothetical protein
MNHDPNVEEVHRIREQMWDECGGDLDRLIEFLRVAEAEPASESSRPRNWTSCGTRTDQMPGVSRAGWHGRLPAGCPRGHRP